MDVKGQTALYVAVVNGHLESTEILLEAGADPNGSRHHRSTPVYHASRVGRGDILKALIRSVLPGPCAFISLLVCLRDDFSEASVFSDPRMPSLCWLLAFFLNWGLVYLFPSGVNLPCHLLSCIA